MRAIAFCTQFTVLVKTQLGNRRAGRRLAGARATLEMDLPAGTATTSVSSNTPRLRLSVGVCNIPHPTKAHYGGEDAYFFSSSTAALGVADGVGGWQEEGINPADYSRCFMAATKQFLEEQDVLTGASLLAAAELEAAAAREAAALEEAASLESAVAPESAVVVEDAAALEDDVAVEDAAAEVQSAVVEDMAASGEPAVVENAAHFSSDDWTDNEEASVMAQQQQAEQQAEQQQAEQQQAEQEPEQKDASEQSFPSTTTSHSMDSNDSTQLLVAALDTAHRSTQFPGSTTACIARLNAAAQRLEIANVGDSGLLLFRQGKLIFQTPVLQHFFDCPLQFGMPPHTDYAEDADIFSLEIQPGDVLVMGSDGLLDNVFMDQIAEVVGAAQRQRGSCVQDMAVTLGQLASKQAQDPEWESPYTKEALEEGLDLPWWEKLANAKFKDGKVQLGKLMGGKVDDITVLVARVDVVEPGA